LGLPCRGRLLPFRWFVLPDVAGFFATLLRRGLRLVMVPVYGMRVVTIGVVLLRILLGILRFLPFVPLPVTLVQFITLVGYVDCLGCQLLVARVWRGTAFACLHLLRDGCTTRLILCTFCCGYHTRFPGSVIPFPAGSGLPPLSLRFLPPAPSCQHTTGSGLLPLPLYYVPCGCSFPVSRVSSSVWFAGCSGLWVGLFTVPLPHHARCRYLATGWFTLLPTGSCAFVIALHGCCALPHAWTPTYRLLSVGSVAALVCCHWLRLPFTRLVGGSSLFVHCCCCFLLLRCGIT